MERWRYEAQHIFVFMNFCCYVSGWIFIMNWSAYFIGTSHTDCFWLLLPINMLIHQLVGHLIHQLFSELMFRGKKPTKNNWRKKKRKIKESPYQLLYLVVAKKCITVQAQPNQQPAVLVLPRYCTASADPGRISCLPPPDRQSRNNADLFITSLLTSYAKFPAQHPELASAICQNIRWASVVTSDHWGLSVTDGTFRSNCLEKSASE